MSVKSRAVKAYVPSNHGFEGFLGRRVEVNRMHENQEGWVSSVEPVTGYIRYYGETHFKPGIWVGIELEKRHHGKGWNAFNDPIAC